MKVLGLTGGTGAGKSTVASYLAQKGAFMIDADKISREVLKKGMPALTEVSAAFSDVLLPDGSLNRKKLAAMVFSDEEKLHTLNRITHKYIIKEIKEALASSKEELTVIDAPLLFEAGLERLCDACLFVTAEKSTRLKRICVRDGLTTEEANARIRAQQEDAFYKQKNCYMIENNETTKELYDKIDTFLKELL